MRTSLTDHVQMGRSTAPNAVDDQLRLLRLVMLNLYGNGWQPEEEMLVIRLLKALLQSQMSLSRVSLDTFTRRNSLFSRCDELPDVL